MSGGWGLTGRLISKHFSALGDKVSEAIASFDPETATAADRDRLAAAVRETATKLASARNAYGKEHQELVALQQQIDGDAKIAEQLLARLQAGTVTEDAVNLFCDELEANKQKLPAKVEAEHGAHEFMDQLQEILNAMSKQLEEFDSRAKAAMQALAAAQSQREMESLRTQHLEELQALKGGLGNHSSALSALANKADKVRNEAEGMHIVNDITQKPQDKAAAVDALRQSVLQGEQSNSAADRLRRLAAN